jgi:hypothetical protein
MKKTPSYAKSGKLTPKEARLLKALMGKLIGEEGMRVMQASGMTGGSPSFLQRIVDEASQVASGVGSAISGEGFGKGYSEAEARDRAEDATGVAGKTDAALTAAGRLVSDIFDDEASNARLYTGETIDLMGRAGDAYDRARMTDEERKQLRIQEAMRTNRLTGPASQRSDTITQEQLERAGGTSTDLINLLAEGKMKGTRPATTFSQAVEEERRRGLPGGSLYPEAQSDLRRSVGFGPR